MFNYRFSYSFFFSGGGRFLTGKFIFAGGGGGKTVYFRPEKPIKRNELNAFTGLAIQYRLVFSFQKSQSLTLGQFLSEKKICYSIFFQGNPHDHLIKYPNFFASKISIEVTHGALLGRQVKEKKSHERVRVFSKYLGEFRYSVRVDMGLSMNLKGKFLDLLRSPKKTKMPVS